MCYPHVPPEIQEQEKELQELRQRFRLVQPHDETCTCFDCQVRRALREVGIELTAGVTIGVITLHSERR